MEHTFGSLFSGCGAMDYGFEQAGWECKWQVEIDENCQKVLAKHFPNTIKYRDITQVNFNTLEPVDLIIGGVPCVDLSLAGAFVVNKKIKQGIHGEQTGLIHYFAQIIDILLPKFFVLENVPGILQAWDEVLSYGYFKHYSMEGKILNGADYGTPTRRRRGFVVGVLGDGSGQQVYNFPVGHKPTFKTGGSEDVLPMCLPWKGGVSLERLGSCIVTEINPVRTV